MCEVVDVVDVVDVMDDVGAAGLRERCIDEWEGDDIFEVAVVCLGEDDARCYRSMTCCGGGTVLMHACMLAVRVDKSMRTFSPSNRLTASALTCQLLKWRKPIVVAQVCGAALT